MNLRELIRANDSIIDFIESPDAKMTFKSLSEKLNIKLEELLELLEEENVIINDTNEKSYISSDTLKQILFKESEISTNNEKDFLSSTFILDAIENINNNSILAIKLCKKLNVSMKMLAEILSKEGYEFDRLIAVTKIDLTKLKSLLKHPSSDTASILQKLEIKINRTTENKYVKSTVLNQFIRSEYIRAYAKIRAQGHCELCEKKAPFNDYLGNPFLEIHHIIYLSKGGSDSIDNVAAICPNCHRKLHNLNLKSDVEKLLYKRQFS